METEIRTAKVYPRGVYRRGGERKQTKEVHASNKNVMELYTCHTVQQSKRKGVGDTGTGSEGGQGRPFRCHT